MPTRPSHAIAFLLGFWLGLTAFLPLAAPSAFATEERADRARADGRAPVARTARAESGTPEDAELASLEAALLGAVNEYRGRHHRVALARRPDLDAVARAHSRDMAARRYLSHASPEGVDWVGRLERAGVTGFAMAAENVGFTTRPDSNAEILSGWVHSPVHRENLLAAPFNATGLGIARGRDGALYYTQLYASFPRDAR